MIEESEADEATSIKSSSAVVVAISEIAAPAMVDSSAPITQQPGTLPSATIFIQTTLLEPLVPFTHVIPCCAFPCCAINFAVSYSFDLD